MTSLKRFWIWLTEPYVEVPEHYYDWMAPRWYVALVGCIYVALVTAVILSVLNVI